MQSNTIMIRVRSVILKQAYNALWHVGLLGYMGVTSTWV